MPRKPYSPSFAVLAKVFIQDAGGTGEVPIFVASSFANAGPWFAAYLRDNGCRAHFKRASLPVRATRQDAEDDLVAFADRRKYFIRRLQPVKEG